MSTFTEATITHFDNPQHYNAFMGHVVAGTRTATLQYHLEQFDKTTNPRVLAGRRADLAVSAKLELSGLMYFAVTDMLGNPRPFFEGLGGWQDDQYLYSNCLLVTNRDDPSAPEFIVCPVNGTAGGVGVKAVHLGDA